MLAARGADVIMAVRNAKKTQAAVDQIKQKLPEAKLTAMDLDLSSLVRGVCHKRDWSDGDLASSSLEGAAGGAFWLTVHLTGITPCPPHQ